MLFAGFNYIGLNNLGDHIQSIATERLIQKVSIRLNRDTLRHEAPDENYFLIMNGWFTHNPIHCFPPAKQIIPVFWGFHIAKHKLVWDHFLSDNCIAYLKKHGPIGCRDRFTAERLAKIGVNTFYSKCLTLTLDKRETEPVNGWNVAVDVPIPLPSFIDNNTIYVSQRRQTEHIPEETKFSHAHRLLDLYRERAKLVITTRLHCALPCLAMGIPVILLGDPGKYRISIAQDVGLKIYDMNRLYKYVDDEDKLQSEIEKIWSIIDWNPQAIDFEKDKKKIISDFGSFLKNRVDKFNNTSK